LGRKAFASGRYEEADHYFKTAVDLRPRELRPNFYHGRAAYELKHFDEAATAFAICVALADHTAWCFYYRGLASMQLGRTDAARRDFDRAIELDPRSPAAIERGKIAYQEQRYDDAIDDFKRVVVDSADNGSVSYALALAYAGKGDRTAALKELDEFLIHEPGHQEALKLAQNLRTGQP
jgi:tetratricopeptide (TPR) repeat protein